MSERKAEAGSPGEAAGSGGSGGAEGEAQAAHGPPKEGKAEAGSPGEAAGSGGSGGAQGEARAPHGPPKRKTVRYEVKVDDQQLTFGSLHELKTLYLQGFVAPEDMVRPEGGERWVRAGTMPALRSSQSKAKTETRMAVIVATALIFSLVVGAYVLKYKTALIGLVLLGAMVPFIAYRKRR